MSDLQIVLIIIGALIIFAVIVINWWQERRFHQQVESSFSTLRSDALLDEPNLDDTPQDSQFDADFASDLDVAGKLNDGDDVPTTVQAKVSQFDEPSFSTEHFSALETEDFSIDDYAASTYSAADELEDHYDSLPDFIKEPLDADSDVVNDELDDKPRKAAQRDDIKAIFEDAFNQKTSSAGSDKNLDTPVNEPAAIPEVATILPLMLHAQMDLTALLYLAEEAQLGKFVGALIGLFDDYDKPVFVHVQDVNKEWHLLKDAAPNLTVTRIACSIQLADRGGAISRHTLNRFQLAAETIGLDINAHVEWQSTGDALTVANALDAFCIDVDKTIGFHLTHGENGPFTGTKLRGLAESQGLTLAADGTFKFLEDAPARQIQQAAFVMFNREDYPFNPDMLRSSVVKGVTFQLDIPHVKHCAEAFNTMVQVARQMEIGLNATLVDDNNKVLGEMQIEKIRQQLKVIHATMLVRGIVPGSESAHRLFS